MARAFISHISEDRHTAGELKAALTRDFLGLLDVFLSSDTQSIAAGEEWLRSIEDALREAAMLLVLCSPESIRRPWINFEAGAAWMREIPLVPICHAGLEVRDLPMPLSLRQGIAAKDPDGLQRLYARVAGLLKCAMPPADFVALAQKFEPAANAQDRQRPAIQQLEAERLIRQKLESSLTHPEYVWRSIESIAAEAAITEEEAANLLRADERVRFSVGRSGKRIAGLKSRVGPHR